MRIRRSMQGPVAISLVAMIDVLMILLVFFMVTSTYLDLNMVTLAGAPDEPIEAGEPRQIGSGADAQRLLIRLGADGLPHVQGRALDGPALSGLIATRLAAAPDLDVIVLPSGQANVQALAALMDVAVTAGAQRLRIVRLEAAK